MSSQSNRPALDVLADRLADRRVLLILDNFEQVLDAAPDVARLLAAAAGVRVLLTSRSVLGLRGEHDLALGPLPTPPADDALLAGGGASPAAQMFVARAQEVRPGFALSAENAAAAALGSGAFAREHAPYALTSALTYALDATAPSVVGAPQSTG